jgi:hypothetical protein
MHDCSAGIIRRLRGRDIELKIVGRLHGCIADWERTVQLHEYWKRGARLHNWLGERAAGK